MNFLKDDENKTQELAAAFNALEVRIREVRDQISSVPAQKLVEIIIGKKSGMSRSPMRRKRVVLTWLAARTLFQSRGLTARELLSDRDALEEYSGTKFPRRVEAYSMFLGRLNKRYVTRVKQGREFRYYITPDGLLYFLKLVKLEKIAEAHIEESRRIAEEAREKALEAREMAFLASLRTKTTVLQMEQMQLIIDKIPEIANTRPGALGIYSMWGKTLIEAAESIQALQVSISRPEDQATRESALNKSEVASGNLLVAIILMGVLVCLLCGSGRYAKDPDKGS